VSDSRDVSSFRDPVACSLEVELVEDGFDRAEEVLLLLGSVTGGGSDSKSLGSDGNCWRRSRRGEGWKEVSERTRSGRRSRNGVGVQGNVIKTCREVDRLHIDAILSQESVRSGLREGGVSDEEGDDVRRTGAVKRERERVSE